MREHSNVKKTTYDVVSLSKQVHGNTYDYSNVEYVNARTKVCIICPEHGEFWQIIYSHIKGKACPKCGDLLKTNKRKINILNKKFEGLVQPEDYKLIPLTQGKYAMVDNEDFDRLKDINWAVTSKGYAYNYIHRLMHRYILCSESNLDIDHKDGNPLNNRKSNLRLATHQQNMWNSKPIKDSSSKYKGVFYDKEKMKWVSYITVNNVRSYLGCYTTEEEAGRAYDLKALELFGEFARLNFK